MNRLTNPQAHREPLRVLRQPAVAHLDEAEHPFEHPEWVLNLGNPVLSDFARCGLSAAVGQGAPRSRRCQDAEGDGCSAHVVITPRSSGNVLAHSRPAAKKIPEFAVTLAIALSGYGALEAEHWPTSTLDAAVILLNAVVIRHNFLGATGSYDTSSCRLYPRVTGTGASGARQVGRPRYLMSCELALLSGRPCDQPGCAVSADP